MDLPDASGDPAPRTRCVPDLRDGVGAGIGQLGRRSKSRAAGHDATLLDRARAERASAGPGDGRPPLRIHRRPGELANVELDPAGARDAGGVVGWLAILRARLGIAAHPQSQHVHTHRDGHRRRVDLQHRRHRRAGDLSGFLPQGHGRRHDLRSGRRLLRGSGRHHGVGTAGPGARTSRPRADLRRDPCAAGSNPHDRPADRRRRLRTGGGPGGGSAGRSAPRASRREGADGRDGGRGPFRAG